MEYSLLIVVLLENDDKILYMLGSYMTEWFEITHPNKPKWSEPLYQMEELKELVHNVIIDILVVILKHVTNIVLMIASVSAVIQVQTMP